MIRCTALCVQKTVQQLVMCTQKIASYFDLKWILLVWDFDINPCLIEGEEVSG